MHNDYLTNTTISCERCGSHRLNVEGEDVVCENCGSDRGNTLPDSSGWDRIWRLASGHDIRYRRL